MSRGILLVISGFSGAGKGTVIRELLHGENKREDCCLSVSATSRAPRPGETEGVSYYFKTAEVFEQMIAEDKFLEYTNYVGNYYGTPREYVMEKLEAGINVILEIEVDGAMQVKSKFNEAVTIFITPPNAEELEKRLRGRQTESEEVIQKRLLKAAEEALSIPHYDYLIINDKVADCVSTISDLIEMEKRRVVNQSEFVAELQEDMKQLADREKK